METIILLAPILGAIIAGFRWRIIRAGNLQGGV